jgi:chromosomal replication initiator protein
MNALMTTTKPPTTTPPVLPTLPVDAVSIDRIKAEVMEFFNIKLLALIGPQKNTANARPRMLAMWLARRLTSLSYPDIGRAFGGRDHSTVISACRKIERLLTTDAALFGHTANIIEALKRGTQLPLAGVH